MYEIKDGPGVNENDSQSPINYNNYTPMDVTNAISKPFPDFKWQWACVACTEGINDPVVLLGVLDRMHKLEGKNLKYSSEEFGKELIELSKALEGTGVDVDLDRRIGDRNIIRNSGQYWKAVGLIPVNPSKKGLIELTPFGRLVAEQRITQTEFAAATIMTMQLPNPAIQDSATCKLWSENHLHLYPLKLILSIARELRSSNLLSDDYTETNAFITPFELYSIIIPLSGMPQTTVNDYVNAIRSYRDGSLDISHFPNCCPMANDKRMAREFLLFLAHYGYTIMKAGKITKDGRSMHDEETYYYNFELDEEILGLLNDSNRTLLEMANMTDVQQLGDLSNIASDVDRKRAVANNRGAAQPKFRKDLFEVSNCCILTEVRAKEVLEAAHIFPVKYNGGYDVSNGFLMRVDIHTLYDANEIRIDPQGNVVTSDRIRMDYGRSIPSHINIPDYVNRDNLKWRWDNYHGM